MNEIAAVGRRQRNTVLQAMELFHRHGRRRAMALIIFLYICENEGLTVTELASLVRKTVSTCARIAIELAGGADGANAGKSLVEFKLSDGDQRLKHIWLSPLGRSLREELDDIIASAISISPDRMHPRRDRLDAKHAAP